MEKIRYIEIPANRVLQAFADGQLKWRKRVMTGRLTNSRWSALVTEA